MSTYMKGREKCRTCYHPHGEVSRLRTDHATALPAVAAKEPYEKGRIPPRARTALEFRTCST